MNVDKGISFLSSIISYGLSSVVGVNTQGVSSLSSIVSYGLSSVVGVNTQGVSSLSSIVSYGLSSVYSPYGTSSLSSIVSYGLSSIAIASQSLTANTYNYTFKASSIGGTDIKDTIANPSNPDTITNSFAKIDNWLFANLVGKPPAPTSNSVITTKSNILVTWTNPLLYSVGLLSNTYIPNITSLYITLSNISNNTNNNIIVTAQSNLPMYKNPITGINFLNTGAFNCNVVPNGTSNILYLTNTNIVSTCNYNITVFFSNYNTNPQIPINFITFNQQTIAGTGVPSAPSNLTANAATSTKLTFNWFAPQYPDASDTSDSSTAIGGYKLITSNDSNFDTTYPRRYLASGSKYDARILTNTTTGTGVTTDVTGLYPDCYYAGMISAKNVVNAGYGDTVNSTTSYKTSLPSAPSRMTAVTLTLTSLFTNQGIPAGARATGAQPIVNYTTMNTGLSFTLTNIAIHTASTPGVSNIDIMRIIASNDTGSSNFFSNSGFLDTTSYSTANCNILIARSGVTDPNLGSNLGFYQTGIYTVTFSNTLLPVSQSPYKIYITQSNQGCNNVTQNNLNVYVETDYSVNPSIPFLSNLNAQAAPTAYITGVCSYSNNAVFTNYLGITNIGKNFLVTGNFASYKLTYGGTDISGLSNAASASTSIYTDSLCTTLYSSGVLPTTAYLNTSLTYNNSTTIYTSDVNTYIRMNIVATNLNGSLAAVNCNISYNGSNYYIDYPSIALIGKYDVTKTVGARVTSGSGTSNPSGYGTIFDNTQSLSSSYTNELALANGVYVTKAALSSAYRLYTGYYGNTVDYSGIASNTTMRYATFKYTTNCNSSFTGTAQFTITYGTQPFITSGSNLAGGVTFQYKVEDNAAPTSISTVWLDGNANQVGGFQANAAVTGGTPGTGGLIITQTNTAIVRTVGILPGTYNNVNFFTRIGIPMNAAYSFINCTLTALS